MRDATVPHGAASTPSASYGRRMLRRRLPLLAGSILALTLLGPFGTFREMGFMLRLGYWGGLIATGWSMFELVVLVARRVLPNLERTWPLMLAAAFLTVGVLQTLVVALLENLLRGEDFLTPAGLAELFGYVLTITTLVSALPVWLELREHGIVGHAPPVPPAAPVSGDVAGDPAAPRPVPFLDRIPARLGRDLLALEMEDHYVRVHTALGSDLILMRMRDAVAELAGIDGRQVHRSYWVAASAVAAVERKPDGKLSLRLINGMLVPVSRTHAPSVRAAGWVEKAVS
ncbi:LytTR family transcriptional regulator [Azospirillum humicireducens]|uniref:LytTR family transcriptional regulator n=1 Tax=Azospirillum humicireducens TaxID=1226968 RepID=A0A160JD35_9PROT|nr:LytTR family DNA-binding domain-containing protein [Azospirillum humicireducens]ANC90602.1 LytTR family transcriptional regulator [Azospirillum humicireducens]